MRAEIEVETELKVVDIEGPQSEEETCQRTQASFAEGEREGSDLEMRAEIEVETELNVVAGGGELQAVTLVEEPQFEETTCQGPQVCFATVILRVWRMISCWACWPSWTGWPSGRRSASRKSMYSRRPRRGS